MGHRFHGYNITLSGSSPPPTLDGIRLDQVDGNRRYDIYVGNTALGIPPSIWRQVPGQRVQVIDLQEQQRILAFAARAMTDSGFTAGVLGQETMVGGMGFTPADVRTFIGRFESSFNIRAGDNPAAPRPD